MSKKHIGMFETKIIELLGMPRSGKTTTAHALNNAFRDKGFNSRIVYKRGSVSPIKDKLSPIFNLWNVLSVFTAYIEACNEQIDYLISDRGVFDARIWLEYFRSDGFGDDITKPILEIINNPILINNISIAFFFRIDVKTSLKREREREIIDKPGRIMNTNVLSRYLECYDRIKPSFGNSLLEIDTEAISIKSMMTKVFDDISILLKRNHNKPVQLFTNTETADVSEHNI